jgi:hypothetical protein
MAENFPYILGVGGKEKADSNAVNRPNNVVNRYIFTLITQYTGKVRNLKRKGLDTRMGKIGMVDRFRLGDGPPAFHYFRQLFSSVI